MKKTKDGSSSPSKKAEIGVSKVSPLKRSTEVVSTRRGAASGKRSEVKDSHDKYANQEISYLTQRD